MSDPGKLVSESEASWWDLEPSRVNRDQQSQQVRNCQEMNLPGEAKTSRLIYLYFQCVGSEPPRLGVQLSPMFPQGFLESIKNRSKTLP